MESALTSHHQSSKIGIKYRDSHQDTMKKLRDIGTVIPTWDVSQTTTPNNLREPCRKGARKIVRYR